ncbi:MAG: ribosome biogenesis GTPase Der [Armatimonadetes bacterium]|nr:ribosome biogenesis GTPase Der [Armatimonadota bacterium]
MAAVVYIFYNRPGASVKKEEFVRVWNPQDLMAVIDLEAQQSTGPGEQPVVAIIGRPNVGKSALFNRLLGARQAIVDEAPGVTRDRIYGQVDWGRNSFFLVDTGGLTENPDDPLIEQVRSQALLAVHEADLILMVVDGKIGPTFEDEEVAQTLRHSGKTVLLVANKIDSIKDERSLAELFGMGFGEPAAISALHGLGIGDLLDLVVERLRPPSHQLAVSEPVRVVIAGRPNVGKSSLLNRLIGRRRAITDPRPGTTRDPLEARLRLGTHTMALVDTAGQKRRSRLKSSLDFYSTLRAQRAVSSGEVVLLCLELDQMAEQDKKIAREIHKAGRACILVVNKWDLRTASTPALSASDVTRRLRTFFPQMAHVPVQFVSALSGKGIPELCEKILQVHEEFHRTISTPGLNEVLARLTASVGLRGSGGRTFRLYYATQLSSAPPRFALFVNSRSQVSDSFLRFLERGVREAFGFYGAPIFWDLREKRRK